jgi:PTH1 family peptidyl-tRNA hydrolase
MIRLVVFLGNPGLEYRRTRHNIAWMLAEQLSFYPDLAWRRKFKGSYAQQQAGSRSCLFLKPGTYMNRSGEGVRLLLDFFRLAPAETLVVHDDLELFFAQAGFKRGGGLGGHNGLRSIDRSLGTSDFYRFRLGIGRPERGSVSSHVLSAFSPAEMAVLPRYLKLAARMLEERLEAGGFDAEPDPGAGIRLVE